MLPAERHRFLLLALCTTPLPLLAQGMDGGQAPPMTKDFDGLIGLSAIYGPEYLGSDKQKARALPLLQARWRNGFFAGFPSGIGLNFAPNQPLQYGLALRADLGRKEDNSEYLRGMGDIKAKSELGAFASFTLNDATVRASLNYGSTDSRKGMTFNLGWTYGMPLASRGRLALSADATFANEDYIRSYFGVSSAQSVTSGYSIYSPSAGLRDVQLGVQYMYPLSRELMLSAGLRAYQLMGDAKDSPIVRSDNGISGQLGLAYRF